MKRAIICNLVVVLLPLLPWMAIIHCIIRVCNTSTNPEFQVPPRINPSSSVPPLESSISIASGSVIINPDSTRPSSIVGRYIIRIQFNHEMILCALSQHSTVFQHERESVPSNSRCLKLEILYLIPGTYHVFVWIREVSPIKGWVATRVRCYMQPEIPSKVAPCRSVTSEYGHSICKLVIT